MVRKMLLVCIMNLVLIVSQTNVYNPMMKTEIAKPVPVDQGGNYDGTRTVEALSVSYQGILS